MNTENVFEELKDILVLECKPDRDVSELVRLAEVVVNENIPVISVPQESVQILWPWLEKTLTKIMTRFYLDKNFDISKLSTEINSVFKKGAGGAQIFVPYSLLSSFVSELLTIRDDLFFNKTLSICLDVDEINPLDWVNVFSEIKKIRADVLLLDFHNDLKKNYDFVGRIYGFLDGLDKDLNTELHFSLNNDYEKIEQVWRLIQKMQPEISKKVKFFIDS